MFPASSLFRRIFPLISPRSSRRLLTAHNETAPSAPRQPASPINPPSSLALIDHLCICLCSPCDGGATLRSRGSNHKAHIGGGGEYFWGELKGPEGAGGGSTPP